MSRTNDSNSLRNNTGTSLQDWQRQQQERQWAEEAARNIAAMYLDGRLSEAEVQAQIDAGQFTRDQFEACHTTLSGVVEVAAIDPAGTPVVSAMNIEPFLELCTIAIEWAVCQVDEPHYIEQLKILQLEVDDWLDGACTDFGPMHAELNEEDARLAKRVQAYKAQRNAEVVFQACLAVSAQPPVVPTTVERVEYKPAGKPGDKTERKLGLVSHRLGTLTACEKLTARGLFGEGCGLEEVIDHLIDTRIAQAVAGCHAALEGAQPGLSL